jgi:glutamate synthase (NADPH/NADH) small chain
MGKPTGFLEYERQLPVHRPPPERVRDWDEQHELAGERMMVEQAARCMNCGTPFCHSGTIIAGAAAGCPINNLIPEWNDLVYRGQWREASVRLHLTNNFPEFTGRVCPAPCEGSCTLGINAAPVTIKSIEQEIAEHAWVKGWIRPEPPLARTGFTVAIIGSGPAGLACAAQLNHAGHEVTVFERADRIGGLLTYGIPNMKLDKRVVERRVQLLADEGIHFVCNTEVGRDVAPDRLRAEFDAVVLAVGSTVPRDLPVEGRDLRGIHPAVSYLHAATKRLLDDEPPDPTLLAAGKRVVVIGGGDTGTDCVATAIRQGAAHVTQLEILPQPPEVRAPDNPWPQWPKIYRMDYGQEEAAALWGADPRQYLVQTRRFLDDGAGRLAGLETVQVEWRPGPDGRPVPRPIEGTERIVPAELALLALGFLGPERSVPEQLGCRLDTRGNISTDAEKMTSVPGIFAAGDCARGQSLVVWAIREGRLAARGVDRYLMSGEVALTALTA